MITKKDRELLHRELDKHLDYIIAAERDQAVKETEERMRGEFKEIQGIAKESSERKKLVQKLRAQGMTFREIAKAIGVKSTSVVAHYLR